MDLRTTLAALAALAAAGPLAAQEFDLDALVAAARAEPPLTIYDNTSKVKAMAEGFAAAYGLQAEGVKISTEQQVELVLREAAAGAI